MELLNTRKFPDIVKFFELEKELSYYKLYNISKYKNSYHGWEHVKRVICSIFALSRDKRLSHQVSKNLMTAAIFHDFNYIGLGDSENYDRKNIEAAVEGYNEYLRKTVDYPKFDPGVVRKLIQVSEYPKCMNSDLNAVEQAFVECDHSMIIHEGYENLCLMFNMNERKLTDCNEIKESVFSYLNTVQYKEPLFFLIWKENKDKIIENTIHFIEEYCPHPENIKFDQELI